MIFYLPFYFQTEDDFKSLKLFSFHLLELRLILYTIF